MERGKKTMGKENKKDAPSALAKQKPAKKPAVKSKKSSAPEKPASGIKKQYFKSQSLCKVTFMLPGIAAPGAGSVCIVGDFNNWSITEHPMKRNKGGDFTISLNLEPGRQYQFRYIIDGCRWENDWNADKYLATEFGDSENSVVIL